VGDHPVKVPEELAGQLWFESADKPSQCNTFRAHVFAQKIAEWAADQELEACCDAIYLHEGRPLCGGTAELLRAARRPKPPTLAEQAKAELDDAVMRGDCITTTDAMPSLRAALNRLAELEANQ
jgi:hypothetical protein